MIEDESFFAVSPAVSAREGFRLPVRRATFRFRHRRFRQFLSLSAGDRPLLSKPLKGGWSLHNLLIYKEKAVKAGRREDLPGGRDEHEGQGPLCATLWRKR